MVFLCRPRSPTQITTSWVLVSSLTAIWSRSGFGAMLSAFYGFKIKSCLFDGIDSIVEDWIVDQVHIPEVETGYENVLLVRLLLKMRMHSFQKSLVFEGLTVEGILKNWSKIKPMIVKDWSENIDARFHLFGKVRDEWIDKDLFDYLDWC
ncbi:uncharacterized protein LOC127902494 isoform X2 [Citrus sinensis]|uniref:uncharacterized protein LOC127902494 isoform X2 n=1 Tax=Citrus sinensis TaxID=2711 RepID=UPI00227956C6|nr:uncharacterized protein LOC127902494 isoform X2 [Citrus sinensis]XP_052297652.1 uncharacterized protein LOC127902494 isoform X2 [Citrus sinensis]